MTRIDRQNSFITACISIPLYLSLAITAFYYAFKFWAVVKGNVEGGLYGTPKFVFFVVLGISAVLDLPTFLTCAGKGGPNECIWDHSTYAIVWCFHLIATCGYLYCVITPSILWSDIIQLKDGNFWNSASPLDGTKIFFRVSYVLYCCVIFTDVLGVILYSKSSNEAQYSNSNAVGAINNCLMPIMLVVITFGCFWSGLRLRQYVMNVQLGNEIQIRILMKLNFTMFMICASYTARAIFVLSLYEGIPADYQRAIKIFWPYSIWVPLTQWIPFVACSFCLVNEMRFHGVGKGVNATGSSKGSSRHSEQKSSPTGTAEATESERTALHSRSKNDSVDSTLSEIAYTISTGTGHSSSRSRSKFLSNTRPESDRGLAMSELGDFYPEEDVKKRTLSADNFFESNHDDFVLSDSKDGIDHFFTTNAMHTRYST